MGGGRRRLLSIESPPMGQVWLALDVDRTKKGRFPPGRTLKINAKFDRLAPKRFVIDDDEIGI